MNKKTYRSIPILNLITASVVLSSCAVGPDFKAPESIISDKFVNSKGFKTEKTPVLNDGSSNKSYDDKNFAWWNSFNDPVLNELLLSSGEKNLTVLSLVQRVEQADAITRGTFFGLFPQPELNFGYIKNQTAGARFPGLTRNGIQFEIFSVGGQASWEIDLFGRVRRELESAGSFKNQSIFNLADTLRLVHSELATTYINLRQYEKQKAIALNNINNQKAILDLTEKKLEVGEGTPLDTERARALTAKTEASLYQYDALISASINRIATLSTLPIEAVYLKLGYDSVGNPLTSYEIPEYAGPITIGSPAELIKKRPDLRALEESLHAAVAEVGVATADLFPRITFTGSMSRDARHISNWPDKAAEAYNYGPQVTWSILNLGVVLNQIDASKAASKAVLYNYQEATLKALEEVETSLSQIRAELGAISLYEKAEASSREAERIASLQYKEGVISYTDLLQTQQSLLQSQSDLASSKARLSLAHVSLYRSLGGAWSEEKSSTDEELQKVAAGPKEERESLEVSSNR